MRSFNDASYRTQCGRLRRLAAKAAGDFGLASRSVRLIRHIENSTFRVVDERGRAYVLRIHRPGYQSGEAIQAELDWLETLRVSGVKVPEAVFAPGGERLLKVRADGVPEARHCVLFRFVHGRLRDEPEVKDFVHLGEMMARMHEAATVTRKSYARARYVGEGGVLMKTFDTFVQRLARVEGDETAAAFRALRDEALNQIEEASPKEFLIHADLHFGNVVYRPKGDPVVIDFDDMGYAPLELDLVTTLMSAYGDSRFGKMRDALFAGYRRVRELPPAYGELERPLMVLRLGLLGEWVATRTDNPRLHGMLRPIYRWIAGRVRALEKGDGTKSIPSLTVRPAWCSHLEVKVLYVPGRGKR